MAEAGEQYVPFYMSLSGGFDLNSLHHLNIYECLKGILWRCVSHAASPIDYLLFSLQYMGFYVFNWPISVLGDSKAISIAHVIIILKSEVSTYPIVIIFFRGCVPEMFVISYSVTYCI